MNVIEIRNVHKSFKIYYDKGATLKEKILFQKRNRYEEHKVLKGIDITIKKGEVVGLIGENGCGKSTLLKLMTKIIYPNKGMVQVNGKVSSLIELGAGFHPDMTGRENIYTNASIFGLTKKEIDKRLEKIIDFSELGEFIDNPVRTYSSGMYMRLAFAVAINVDAEILLVDEILAVGDAAFQAKCFNKMQEIKNSGATIVIVSHDSTAIEKLCDRAIWIDKGCKKSDGNPYHVNALYIDSVMNAHHKKQSNNNKNEIDKESSREIEENIVEGQSRTGNRDVEITGVKIINNSNLEEVHSFKPEEGITIIVDYKRNNIDIKDTVVGVGIFRMDGIQCYGTNTYIDNGQLLRLNDKGKIKIVIDKIQLLEGKYSLDIALHDKNGAPYDYFRGIKEFNIYSNIKDVGIFRIEHLICTEI